MTKNENYQKILICRPRGGFNDMLNRIEYCYRYALSHKRLLYIDGRAGGFLDDFGNYFIPPDGITFEKPALDGPPFDVFPPILRDDIDNYKVEYKTLDDSGVHFFTGGIPLLFDVERDYEEKILLYEQCGGGGGGINILAQLRLKPELRGHIRSIIDKLGKYDAIHIRNTDYKTDYKSYFFKIKNKLAQDAVLCTDDYECQRYAKEFFGGKLKIVTDIPDLSKTQSKTLHDNLELDRYKTNTGMLADLFILACSENLFFTAHKSAVKNLKDFFQTAKRLKNVFFSATKGLHIQQAVLRSGASGFSLLAEALHDRKDIIDKLLYKE
jgi:hypothetical protein